MNNYSTLATSTSFGTLVVMIYKRGPACRVASNKKQEVTKMTKLLAITALSIAISFPSLSVAELQPFGVKTPIERTSVENKIDGGSTVIDYMDFYFNPIEKNSGNTIGTDHIDKVEESYVVFGVSIPVKSGS